MRSGVLVRLRSVDPAPRIPALRALIAATGEPLRWAKRQVLDPVSAGRVVLVGVGDERELARLRSAGWDAALADGGDVRVCLQLPAAQLTDLRALAASHGWNLSVL